MNKNIYRIVFNRLRGQLMAVAETAAAQGKDAAAGGATHTATGAHPFFGGMTNLKLALFCLFGLVTVISTANAQIVADPNAPKNQQPTVLNAGNGVPVVNIQTPSAAGVSRNTYQQFDVNGNGAILNNSRSNVQTQQGGWVQGNPWLATGSARVIVNEVNSSNPSQLRGYVEVAGQRAQVIIANPAGIACDGCGFINADRGTLTTGTPVFNNGNLESFRVTQGTVSINGAGLDATRTDYTQILARAVQVNAGIWANNLSVVTGANDVRADEPSPSAQSGVTPLAADANRPGYAIDVAQLGGMYAGKIVLVGTEAGVGVRNAGHIGASAGEAVVMADGRIENAGTLTASNDVRVSGQHGLQNSGTIYAGQGINADVTGTVQNGGLIGAAQDVSLTAHHGANEGGRIVNTASGTLAAGLNADYTLSDRGQLRMSAEDSIQATGQLLSGQGQQWTAPNVDLAGSLIQSGQINAAGQDLNLSGTTMRVTGQAQLDAAGQLTTQGASISAQRLLVAAHDIDNTDGELLQTGSDALNLSLAGNLDNTRGRIANNGELTIAAQNVVNADGTLSATGTLSVDTGSLNSRAGTIESGGAQSLTVTGNLDNSGGTVRTAGPLTVTASSLTNTSGHLLQSGTDATSITTGALDNTNGEIAGNGAGTIHAADITSANGAISFAGALNVHAQNLDNRAGTIQSDDALNIQASGHVVDTDGKIIGQRSLTLAADSVDNTRGNILNTGDDALTVTTRGALINAQGQIAGNGAGTLTVGSLDNGSGSVSVTGPLTVDTQMLTNRAGTIQSDDALNVRAASSVDNSGGALIGQRSTNVSAGSLNNTDGRILNTGTESLTVTATGDITNVNGNIAGNGSGAIRAANINSDGGTISLGGALDVNAAQLSNRHGGSIESDGAQRLTVAGSLDNSSGSIYTSDNLDLHAGSLTNADGAILQGGDGAMSITADTTLDNTGGTIAGNSGHAQITAQRIGNDAGGMINVAGALQLNSQSLTNAGGTIIGGDTLTVAGAQTIDNRSGGFIGANHAVSVDTQSLTNNGGTVQSVDGALVVQANTIDNRQGALAAGTSATITGAALDNSAGLVLGGTDLVIDTQGQALANTGGTLAAQNTVHIDSGQLDNTGGLIQSGDSLTLDTHGQQLTNAASGDKNGILAGGDATLRTGDLNNETGFIGVNGNLSLHADNTVKNGAGSVNAQGNIDLSANTVDNGSSGQYGVVQGMGDVTVTASNVVNDGSLMRAGGTLDVHADTLSNTGTNNKDYGLEGGHVALTANTVNNTGGGVRADQGVTLTSAGTLDNSSGAISGNTVAVKDTSSARTLAIYNDGGVLLAGEALTVDAGSLDGAGALASFGDASVSLQGDVTNSNTIQGNGNVDVATTGTLTNQSLIEAGNVLTVHAANIDNAVNGEISATVTHLTTPGTLTNRGLIDGSLTWLESNELDNLGTGRIYGDGVAISTGRLVNGAETTTQPDGSQQTRAAVIAARGDMELGAQQIDNGAHAMLFSAGDMHIGGALDENLAATGRADALTNHSATIESLGNMTLAVGQIQNLNDHFETEQVDVSSQHVVAYTGDINHATPGTLYTEADNGAYVTYGSRNNLYIIDANGNPQRISTEFDRWIYDETVSESRVTQTDPGVIQAGGDMGLDIGDMYNAQSKVIAGGTLYGNADAIRNDGGTGERLTTRTGTYTQFRNQSTTNFAYKPALPAQDIDLGAVVVQQHSAAGGSGTTVDARQQDGVQGSVPGAGQATLSRDGTGSTIDAPGALPGQTGTSSRTGAGAGAPSPIIEVSTGDNQSVRTSTPNISLPDNSLFNLDYNRPNGAVPTGNYLVETDPRFANYRSWLSSDYMISALGLSPENTQKRLGDGFYEQMLVREQVSQLTGGRYLADYRSDEEQYMALLNAGATFAQQYHLTLGTALTPEQMALLTSDIVWLVEEEVTMPGGYQARVLVPQVYARVRPGDIDGTGSLIAARDVQLNLSGDLANNGTIAARNTLAITAQNVAQTGGRISANTVDLTARDDLVHNGGLISGTQAVSLTAGRDIVIASQTKSASNEQSSNTGISRVAGVQVGGAGSVGGTLTIHADRDVTLSGANLSNSSTGGLTKITAGNDLTIGTVTVASDQRFGSATDRNHRLDSSSMEVGSSVTSAGDIKLDAGHDLTARASTVQADGAINAHAGNDVNIVAGDASQSFDTASYEEGKGFLSKNSLSRRTQGEDQLAVASTFSGDTVRLDAGHDLNVIGSNVVSDMGTTLVAGNDVNILAAQETHSELQQSETKKSGFLYNGGMAFSLGTQEQSATGRTVSTTAAASTVGSTQGDVSITAGNHYQQTGSDVLAPQGNIDITAKKADIVEAREANRSEEEHKFRQSGLTVAVTSPIVSMIQTGEQMSRAAGKVSDPRMQALAGATTALAVKNAADAVQSDPSAGGGIGISVTVGGSRSESKSTTTSDTASGSRVAAGGNVTIRATGAGENSDLTIQGSDVSAGGKVHLQADNDINLLAAQNTSEMNRSSSGSSGGVGVAIQVGSKGMAMGFTANASTSKGKGNGTDVTWTNTHVTGAQGVEFESGNDTRLAGATIDGEYVKGTVGGNLSITSLQDTSTFHSSQQSMGGSVTAGVGFSGGVSYSQGNMNSDWASVTEQSGIYTGSGGYQLDVAGNTHLTGAVIASNSDAIANGRNSLSTETLQVDDIQNHGNISGSSMGLGANFGVSSGDKGASTSQDSSWARMQEFRDGQNVTTPTYAWANEKDSSTTHSALSEGNIVIRNDDKQQALTGQTAAETLASLNHDTASAQNSLDNHFDEDALQAQFAVATAFQQQVGTFMNNRMAEIDALKDQSKKLHAEAMDESLPLDVRQAKEAQAKQLDAQIVDQESTWGMGGWGRLALTALGGASGSNVLGGLEGLAQGSVVNYLQGLGAQGVKALADELDSDVARGALHGILACAGAAANSQGCGAAALGAMGSVVLNDLLDSVLADSSTLSEADRQKRADLVATLIGATGAALGDGTSAATAENAARLETENNQLAQVYEFMVQQMGAILGAQRNKNGFGKKNDELAAFDDASGALPSDGPSAKDSMNLTMLRIAQQYKDNPVMAGMPPTLSFIVAWFSTLVDPPGKDAGILVTPIQENNPKNNIFINPAGNESKKGDNVLINPVDSGGSYTNSPPEGYQAADPAKPSDHVFTSSNASNGTPTVPPSILGANGALPSGIGGVGTPIPMPPTSNPDKTAEQFAEAAFNGQTPVKVVNGITGAGSWVAIMPDGTAITYRPAGQASSATDSNTATVEINSPSVKNINNGNVAKFKFPKKT